jgi:hypothetical protein
VIIDEVDIMFPSIATNIPLFCCLAWYLRITQSFQYAKNTSISSVNFNDRSIFITHGVVLQLSIEFFLEKLLVKCSLYS